MLRIELPYVRTSVYCGVMLDVALKTTQCSPTCDVTGMELASLLSLYSFLPLRAVDVLKASARTDKVDMEIARDASTRYTRAPVL